MMETSFVDAKHYPMIESMQKYINNSSYIIEDDAMSGWKRGGISAREIARKQDKQ